MKSGRIYLGVLVLKFGTYTSAQFRFLRSHHALHELPLFGHWNFAADWVESLWLDLEMICPLASPLGYVTPPCRVKPLVSLLLALVPGALVLLGMSAGRPSQAIWAYSAGKHS